MLRLLVSIFCLCCAVGIALSQGDYQHTITYIAEPESAPREHALDMQKMSIDVTFDTKLAQVNGKVTHTFSVLQRKVDSVKLDAVKIKVMQVMAGGKPARFRSDDSSLTIYFEPPMKWGTKSTIDITYQATPRKGLYFVGWQDSSAGRMSQIWTQGQLADNKHWIPMYDEQNDKLITEATVTFDSMYHVVSNGERKSVIANTDGTKTWRYEMKQPHSSYLLMLAVGKYDTTQLQCSNGTRIELYSYPGKREQIQPTYAPMIQIMEFLESAIGIKYPWGVYRQVPVADYIFGAMENTTATVFGDFYLTDARERLDRSYQGVNIHELTHQWFGDYITARHHKHNWLHESFATYYPLLYTLRFDGLDAYQWSLRGMQNAALSAGDKDRLPIVSTRSGGSRIYQKGACVLDMMRSTFGEDEMKRVILSYTQRHAFGTVETNDLYQAFQDTLGLSPAWFFDQWLYRGGEPHFDVSYINSSVEATEGSSQATLVRVSQIQPTDQLTGYYKVETTVEAHYTDGTKDSVRVKIDGPSTTVSIPNPTNKDLSFVLFDPGTRILKRLTFKRSQAELIAQVQHAPYMIDRYDAFVALTSDSSNNKVAFDLATSMFNKESFHAMRSEAVRFMTKRGYAGDTKAWELVGKGLADRHVEVRKAALYSLTRVPDVLRDEVEEMLSDSSYHVIQNALTRLCRTFPTDADRFVNKVKGVRSPGALVEIIAAEIETDKGLIRNDETIPRYCGPAYEFQTRQNAIKAMKRLGLLSSTAARNMVDAACSTNERLAAVALETMDYLWEQNDWKDLLRSAVLGYPIPTEKKARFEKYSN